MFKTMNIHFNIKISIHTSPNEKKLNTGTPYLSEPYIFTYCFFI